MRLCIKKYFLQIYIYVFNLCILLKNRSDHTINVRRTAEITTNSEWYLLLGMIDYISIILNKYLKLHNDDMYIIST